MEAHADQRSDHGALVSLPVYLTVCEVSFRLLPIHKSDRGQESQDTYPISDCLFINI